LAGTLVRELITVISEKLGHQIITYDTVHGGDINRALKLCTKDNTYFCKYNTTKYHIGIIESEMEGLHILSKSGVRIPNNIILIHFAEQSALVMDWIESRDKRTYGKSNGSFVDQLVILHQSKHTYFGGAKDNFIGSLIQKNSWYNNFTDYYYGSRLLPQFVLAYDNGYFGDYKVLESIAKKLYNIIPSELPTLIHGDLWSGNYIISKDAEAYFIDPSVSYGHREMDIAMLHLFGQVSKTVMNIYNEKLPLIKGWESRMDIFQLYYLIVHLNIFGRSYLDQVESILRRYA